MTEDRLYKMLWSIAVPGFGQLLNGKYLKGLLLIALEFLINIQSNLNEVIVLSFIGKTEQAVAVTNYEWLMFYPCVYMFGIWDAFRDGDGPALPYYYLPFVCGAYFGTVGIIYSRSCSVLGFIPGPVWMGILVFLFGLFAGILLRHGILAIQRRKRPTAVP